METTKNNKHNPERQRQTIHTNPIHSINAEWETPPWERRFALRNKIQWSTDSRVTPIPLHQLLHFHGDLISQCLVFSRIWGWLQPHLSCCYLYCKLLLTVESQPKYSHFWAVFPSWEGCTMGESCAMLYPPIGLFVCFLKPGHACTILHAYLPLGPYLPSAWVLLLSQLAL